jgi:AcrR family transcriptional regulator
MSSGPTTRARVHASTLELIKSARGPISMSAIAKASGLSRQALYLLFKDKADLFIGLLRYADARRGLVEEIAHIRAASSAADMLTALVGLQARLGRGYKPLYDAFEILRRQDEDAETAWQDRQQQRLEGCKAIVARFVAEGGLHDGLDQVSAADVVWTMTSMATWDDLVVRRGWTDRQYSQRLADQLLAFLTPISIDPPAARY